MTEPSTLARPYARAAFACARQQQMLPAWSTMLAAAAAVAQEPQVVRQLAAPGLSAPDKADVLITLCGDALDQGGRNFLHILAENGRLVLLADVARLFEQLKAAAEREAMVEITSAMPLEEEMTQRLSRALGVRLGQTVNVSVRIDESLLGGAVVRVGDEVMDGSVRGRLQRLAETVNN